MILQSAWNSMSVAEDTSAHSPSPDNVPLGRGKMVARLRRKYSLRDRMKQSGSRLDA